MGGLGIEGLGIFFFISVIVDWLGCLFVIGVYKCNFFIIRKYIKFKIDKIKWGLYREYIFNEFMYVVKLVLSVFFKF